MLWYYPGDIVEVTSHQAEPYNIIVFVFRTNGENTPMQVVSALRLERACLLLKSTDLPVKQVAFESGFNDFNHFCRWFRRHKGSSPGRYRAALNLNNFFYSAVLGCTLWCL